MSSSGDAPPPAKQEVVEGVLGAVAAGIAEFLATPSNAADRKVVVVEAVWNEIPPLWGAVRLTLWVTVDVHGTVHKVAYQDSESGLAQALPSGRKRCTTPRPARSPGSTETQRQINCRVDAQGGWHRLTQPDTG